ncbi:MAG: hypothetical protein FJ318_09465 [SAR202 cluster bacterium]|nr:hypothetical protein [SAR202 cluster bacterium]
MRSLVTAGILGCIALIAAGCGSGGVGPLSAPRDCGFGTGSADQAAFANHFAGMAFANGAPGAEGPAFAMNDAPRIAVEALADTATRLCVQERRGGGQIVFDETPTLARGAAETSLPAIVKKGTYVVRVGVDGMLVKNLPFSVE